MSRPGANGANDFRLVAPDLDPHATIGLRQHGNLTAFCAAIATHLRACGTSWYALLAARRHVALERLVARRESSKVYLNHAGAIVQRQGIGTALVRHTLTQAAQHGYNVQTTAGSSGARAFIQKLGVAKVVDTQNTYRMTVDVLANGMVTRSGLDTFRLALIVAFSLFALPIAFAAGPPPPSSSPPPSPPPSFIATPLNDLGTGTYLGFQGGLYENGRNTMFPTHNSIGLSLASQIQPVDGNGNLNTNGKIVLISLGMSSASNEWCRGALDGAGNLFTPEGTCDSQSFMGQAASNASVNHKTLVIKDGALGGQGAINWTCPYGTSAACPAGGGGQNNYDRVRDTILAPAGLTEKQVQVVWVQDTDADPTVSLPSANADAYTLESYLAQIVRAIHVRWPKVKMVFLSSKIYGGYATTRLNPEPYSYEAGFSVKWLIQAQINRLRNGAVDPITGDLSYNVAPWLAWGPYLWADGTRPRSDGFVWCNGQQGPPCNGEADFWNGDYTHPSLAGVRKTGNLLMNFFLNSPFTAPWFK